MTPGPLTVRQVVLDATDIRGLAEFYRELLDLHYRPGDEPPAVGDWYVLRGAGVQLAFQEVADLPRATWPEGAVPQQLHLDLTVGTVEDLAAHHERALALGVRLLLDRHDDPEERLYVYADPAGHPFCIFVG
jgi:catechol-2,3-dioxygenase